MEPTQANPSGGDDEDAAHAVVTRVTPVGGVAELQGLIVPLDRLVSSTEASAWDLNRSVSVDQWRTAVEVPQEDQTAAERTDIMLAELGWQRVASSTGHGDEPRLVRRLAGVFRAHAVTTGDGERVVVVTHASGEEVANYRVDESDVALTLSRHGWEILRTLVDLADVPLLVSPVDWRSVIAEAARSRADAKRAANASDQCWRTLIREALKAGQSPKSVASVAGVTPVRIYQIRDGRR